MEEIEAAYLSGFFPSTEGLSYEELKAEAVEWLTSTLFII